MSLLEVYVELFEEIIRKKWEKRFSDILVPNEQWENAILVEMECYRALKQIKAIIEDDSLDDPECFFKVEKIVCVFEGIGSNGGNRHDFG